MNFVVAANFGAFLRYTAQSPRLWASRNWRWSAQVSNHPRARRSPRFLVATELGTVAGYFAPVAADLAIM
jgi:hypothetical protein